MMRYGLVILSLLLWASTASAQVAATKWELRFYLAGAANPTSTQIILVADTTCNIDTSQPQPGWSARWVQDGQGTCQWISPVGGVLQSRPVGVVYDVGLVAINNDTDGPSAESNRVGFRLPAVASAPTGLTLRSGS